MSVVSNRGVQFGSSSKHSTASFPRGRVCQAEGCLTILSVYNPLAWCSVHERPAGRMATAVRH